MLRQFSIRSRLAAVISIPLLALIVVIAVSLRSMSSINADIDSLYADRIVPLKQIKATSDAYGITIVDAFHKFRGGMIDARQMDQDIQNALELAAAEWQSYKATQLTDEESALIRNADQRLTHVLALIRALRDSAGDGTLAEMPPSEFIPRLYNTFDPLTSDLNELILLQLRVSASFTQSSDESFHTLFRGLSVGVFILLIILVVAGIGIYHSVNRPLQTLENTIQRVARDSDLSIAIPLDGNDEITRVSRSFSTLMNSFRSLIKELRDAVHQSSTAAEEMNVISLQVSRTVSAQEEQLAMVATAITEMSGAVKEVANNANETSAQASAADRLANEGKHKVNSNLAAINTLSDSVKEAVIVIRSLHQQSAGITEVLTVIRSIAEQTNLLALNAAIESARAGDAGRGFAVVADEVRKLAQNTQQATTSISDMIDQLQDSALQAVGRMDQADREANAGVAFTEDSGRLLESITQAVSRIADMNFQVSTATEEQSKVADDITENINRFSMSLAEVAESAQQSSQASSEIARLSSALQHQVDIFKT